MTFVTRISSCHHHSLSVPSLLPPGSTLFPYTTLFRSAAPCGHGRTSRGRRRWRPSPCRSTVPAPPWRSPRRRAARSEEHTSELQSPCNLVCRLLLEKKKRTKRVDV